MRQDKAPSTLVFAHCLSTFSPLSLHKVLTKAEGNTLHGVLSHTGSWRLPQVETKWAEKELGLLYVYKKGLRWKFLLKALRKKSFSSVFTMALPSVIIHAYGLKHSNSLFFSSGSAIAMVFINTWCEMIRTLKIQCTDVWYNFISLASLINHNCGCHICSHGVAIRIQW